MWLACQLRSTRPPWVSITKVGTAEWPLEKRDGRAWRIDSRQTISISPDAGEAATGSGSRHPPQGEQVPQDQENTQDGALAVHIGGHPAQGIGQLPPGQPRQHPGIGAQGIAVKAGGAAGLQPRPTSIRLLSDSRLCVGWVRCFLVLKLTLMGC